MFVTKSIEVSDGVCEVGDTVYCLITNSTLNTKYGDKFKVVGQTSDESYPIIIETKNGKEINMKKDYLSIKKPVNLNFL